MKLISFLTEIASDKKADNKLVRVTSGAMLKKLEQKRSEGRGGWWHDSCQIEDLWDMVNDHLDRCKDDPEQIIDCINLLAMIRFKLNLNNK